MGLIVSLDENQQASGELFYDDGVSELNDRTFSTFITFLFVFFNIFNQFLKKQSSFMAPSNFQMYNFLKSSMKNK